MPVFVVTHRPRDEVVKGKTTFTFVTEGIKPAIEQAIVAAGDKVVHIRRLPGKSIEPNQRIRGGGRPVGP